MRYLLTALTGRQRIFTRLIFEGPVMINIPPAKSVPLYNPEMADTYEKTSSLAQQTIAVRNAVSPSNWDRLTVPTLLVHSISENNQNHGTELFEQPAQELFSKWDLISTSLINVSNVGAFSDVPLRDNNYVERFTGCYGDISLILEVPSQNIYGAHAADVWVDNFAGETDPEGLADHLKSNINFLNKPVEDGFSRFVSPTRLLAETKNYNEVLVMGRNDVNIHAGEKATGNIKVLGILSARSKKYLAPEREKQAQLAHEKNIERLLAVNDGLMVVEV
jgi:hypothetical protein